MRRLNRWIRSMFAVPGSARRGGRRLQFDPLEDRTVPSFSEFVDPNPSPNNGFGLQVVPLSTGNVVITASFDDAGGVDAGAVYLFSGATGALISTLRGSQHGDNLGIGGITKLSNGNFVVLSPNWDYGNLSNVGAITWGSGTTGVSGIATLTNSRVGTVENDLNSTGVLALSGGGFVAVCPFWDNGIATDAGAVMFGNGTSPITGLISNLNSLVGSSSNDNIGEVIPLANGNYVIRSTNWDNGAATDAGAVTWGSGSTGVTGTITAVNSLVGTTLFDAVGNPGVTALSNGNYVVRTNNWDSGTISNVGAVTWGNGTTGTVGTISSSNSLIGATAGDTVGSGGITQLTNGDYVIISNGWDNGAVADAGAVTKGSGATGISGVVSASNSLVGSTTLDFVGNGGIYEVANGNYVVRSPNWDNGTATNAGAVTWINGTTGLVGPVTSSNSLVGSKSSDGVGSAITVLPSGNYVVRSQVWDNGSTVNAGAVTWVNGTIGKSGAVSASNSLVGSSASDQVGGGDITVLSNGNYVVRSPNWDKGAVGDAGAVTWANGTVGITGTVSATNSLTGTVTNDLVGANGLFTLTSGNYLVLSSNWDNGTIVDAGAVTWANGATGLVGAVSASNSLVGSTANDQVGSPSTITALTNGNYVVRSSNWDHGTIVNAGAVTWGNGTTGIAGAISASNSLIGSTANDTVGNNGVTTLTNGNYVVLSPNWDNGAIVNAGAVTWGNGTTGIAGVVSASNSLVGSTGSDSVGNSGVTALTNGNYVVRSTVWDNGAIVSAGAVTWGNGTTGIVGVISASNSLIGSTASDSIGGDAVTALANGNYIVRNQNWDNGTFVNAGAMTWGNGATGVTGIISAENSLIGLSALSSMGTVILDNPNDIFLAPFTTEVGGGRVRRGSQSTGIFHTPYDILLSNSTILENSPSNTIVGTLTSIDPDLGDSATYSLVTGTGDTDNALFNISGNQLRATNAFNYELGLSYSIRVRVTDSTARTYDEIVLITVDDRPHTLPTVYVDDDWAALGNGTVIPDADPSVAGNQPATIGTTAFAIPEWAADVVATSGTIVLNAGTYPQTLYLSVAFTLKVTGSTTLSGVVTGAAGLVKSGNGTLVLSGINTHTGGTSVLRGLLQFASNAALGQVDEPVTVQAPGSLVVTATTTTSRIFNLNLGALQVNSGVTLNLIAAEVNGGFLKGPGLIATASGTTTSFTGVVAQLGARIQANGPDLFTHVTSGSQLTVAAGQTVTFDGFTNSAGGRLVIHGSVLASDFVTYGYVEVSKAIGAPASGWLRNVGYTPFIVAGGGSLNVGYSLPLSGAPGPIGGIGGNQATREGRGRIDLGDGGLHVLGGGVLRNNGFIDSTSTADDPPQLRLEYGSVYFYGSSPGSALGFVELYNLGGRTIAGF